MTYGTNSHIIYVAAGPCKVNWAPSSGITSYRPQLHEAGPGPIVLITHFATAFSADGSLGVAVGVPTRLSLTLKRKPDG